MGYTDQEHVSIAKLEYQKFEVGDPVKMTGTEVVIGYVSEVIDNKKTGEQAFVITDGNPNLQKPGDVNHVTILYQGSKGFDKALKEPGEVKRDWWDNNKKILENVTASFDDPQAVYKPTKQMKSSAETLNNAMDKYYNARFDTYGHSQASSNVQYALGALNSQDKIDRISGAFIYQGPNAYSMLTKEQRAVVNQLKGRIFNFVDEKDMVPIGYRVLPGQVNPFHIGTLIFIDSTGVGMTDQHMWGGYQFSNNQLLVTKESLQQFKKIQQEYNQYMMASTLSNLAKLEKKLTASGGGLSSSERIYLDDSQALAVVSYASSEFETAMLSVIVLYQRAILEAEELWRDTLSDARAIGTDLSESEIISALSSVGCTKQSIVEVPTKECNDKIKKVKKMSEEFRQLATDIRNKVKELVQRDKDLASQLKGLVS